MLFHYVTFIVYIDENYQQIQFVKQFQNLFIDLFTLTLKLKIGLINWFSNFSLNKINFNLKDNILFDFKNLKKSLFLNIEF